jgi:hypothetical protein
MMKAMKTFPILMLIMTGALLSGCATGKNGLVLNTVGPPLSQPTAAS